MSALTASCVALAVRAMLITSAPIHAIPAVTTKTRTGDITSDIMSICAMITP